MTDQDTKQIFQQLMNNPLIFMNCPSSLLRVFLVFCQLIKNSNELLAIMRLKQSFLVFTSRFLRHEDKIEIWGVKFQIPTDYVTRKISNNKLIKLT